jgi:hypothetical protein
MIRKFFTVAVVTALASSIGYLVGAWVIIYGLRPAHPDIAPASLFHEAWSHTSVEVLSLMVLELFSFACAISRIALLALGYVVSIAAEVSGLVAIFQGLLADFSAFDSIWWQLILGSAPIVIASTVVLIYFRTRSVHAIAA